MKRIVREDDIYQLWIFLSRARHSILKLRQKGLSPYNITHGQANVLFIVHRLGEEATFGEIAKYMYRELNTLSVQMKRMEKDGLVKRIRVKPKTTLTRFELTDKGLELYKVSKNLKVINEIFLKLSSEERQQLHSILAKLIHESEERFNTM